MHLGNRPIFGIIGGLHLFAASDDVEGGTAIKLRKYHVANLLAAHCMGIEATYLTVGSSSETLLATLEKYLDSDSPNAEVKLSEIEDIIQGKIEGPAWYWRKICESYARLKTSVVGRGKTE